MIWFRGISKVVNLPNMKKLTLATLLILSCATAWTADFDKGLAVYNVGDYATAQAEWRPLADQEMQMLSECLVDYMTMA